MIYKAIEKLDSLKRKSDIPVTENLENHGLCSRIKKGADMKFSFYDFKEKYGEFIYNKLNDFISSEINERTIEAISFFVRNQQISGVYEGNQYVIFKERNNNILTIIDEVSEEQGVSSDQTRFELSIIDLLEIMKKD